jgi:hypothetical protein
MASRGEILAGRHHQGTQSLVTVDTEPEASGAVNRVMRGVCERALKPPSVGEGYAMNEPMITGCQPDSGNPTVRDERGACGNVTVMGVGLRATGKPVERPPNPKMVRALYFYPTKQHVALQDARDARDPRDAAW